MSDQATQELVLVTGFPRIVARLVVRELLETARSPRRVVMLVRNKFLRDAEAFLKSFPRGHTVEILEGDAAAIDLGLSGREYKELAGAVTHIQHHAQVSYEAADPRVVRALNVHGAREIIEFAHNAPRLRALVHHSSTAVAGNRRGVVLEDELEKGQRFDSPIAQSLYAAERVMRAASATLPVIILRPAMIVGHSRSGEIDRLDGPYLLILLILTSPVDVPLPAIGDAPLQLVPVDYVARAATHLMDDPNAVGKTFHLVDPSPLTAQRVYELVAATAGRRLPRGFIPVNITRALLRTPGLEKFVKSPRAFLEQLATPALFDARNAREILVPNNITCPPFATYVDTMVTAVRERHAARRAQEREDSEVELVEDPLG